MMRSHCHNAPCYEGEYDPALRCIGSRCSVCDEETLPFDDVKTDKGWAVVSDEGLSCFVSHFKRGAQALPKVKGWSIREVRITEVRSRS